MCLPVAVLSLGLGIASAGMSFVGQQQAANDQSRANAQTAANAEQAYRNDYEVAARQEQQVADRAMGDKFENNLETLRATSRARVAAGESGVAGLSVDALVRDLYGRGERANASAEDAANADIDSIRAGLSNSRTIANNRIGSLSKPTSALGRVAGLGISVGGDYLKYADSKKVV